MNAMIKYQFNKKSPIPVQNKIQWEQLLSQSQLVSKQMFQFPQIKACTLRMTYSKLEHANNHNNQNELDRFGSLQATKGSFLLDKEGKSSQSLIKRKSKKQKLFQERYKKDSNSKQIKKLSYTIDVAQINQLGRSSKNLNPQQSKFSAQTGKYQNFNDYLKKIVISQKSNFEVTKLYSQGKVMQMTDRGSFQKLERLKLSILNRKIQEKQEKFHGLSKKLKLQNYKSITSQLPQLQNKSPSICKKQIKKQQYKSNQPINSFQFEPWQIDQINFDFQYK